MSTSSGWRLAISAGVAIMLGAGFSPSTLRAQDTTEVFVLNTPASVRFAGLNGAGAALVGHAGTIFSNPAGLATVSHVTLEGGYQTAPGDGYVTTAALGWRLRQFDLGFGLLYHDIGSDGLGLPLSGAYEALGVGSLVYRYGLLAFGVSGKYVRQSVGDFVDDGTSADLGVAIAVFDIMALGFAVQNVGGNWQNQSTIEMARLTRFGFTMNYVDPQGTFRLMSTIEWQWPDERDSRFVLGGEGGVVLGRVGVVGRLAYGTDGDEIGGTDVTFGASMELAWVDIDVALEPRPSPVRDIKRIGLRFAF